MLGPEPARDVLDQGALIRPRDGAMNMATSPGSPWLVGAAVGALVGLVGRVALLVPFLKDLGGADAMMVGVISGAIGLLLGGAAGATGGPSRARSWGAALSALISAGTSGSCWQPARSSVPTRRPSSPWSLRVRWPVVSVAHRRRWRPDAALRVRTGLRPDQRL